VDKFERNLEAYKKSSYKEEQIKQEFINPFFKALGWDVDNEEGAAPQYRDVIFEDSIKESYGSKAPDYCFTIAGRRMFFVEAKHPSFNIEKDITSSYQLRRYAWSAKLPLSILTDFEELAVYGSRSRPQQTGMASHGRIAYFKYKDYVEKWEEIYKIFSKESVLKGSLKKFSERTYRKRVSAIGNNRKKLDFEVDLIKINGSPIPGINLINVLKGHSDTINQLVWSPDGNYLASPSEDDSIRIWDSNTGECIKILENKIEETQSNLFGAHINNIRGPMGAIIVDWSPDGSMLAWGSLWGEICIIDTKSWETIIQLSATEYQINCLAWSPDGKYIASSSVDPINQICIWDVEEWHIINRYNGHDAAVSSLAWSPDGNYIASGSHDNSIHIWEYKSGENCTIMYNNWGIVNNIIWLNQDEIASSHDENILIWNLNSNEKINLEGHTDLVNCLSYFQHNDIYLLASKSSDNTVIFWNCETWTPIIKLTENTNNRGIFYSGLSFNPAKPFFATLGGYDTYIRIWEINRNVLLNNDLGVKYTQYTNAKVVLMGNSSTGKTCLTRALMDKTFKPQESTHGMKVWSFYSDVQRTDDTEINREIFLWDLAGQPDYQLVHQLFLDDTALGVVVFDSTDPNNPFNGVEYWDKALAKIVTKTCPKILVSGRVDRGHSTVTSEDIKNFCNENDFIFFIETSSKTGTGIPELKDSIKNEINWDKLSLTSSPELWKDFIKYIFERRDSTDVLTKRMDLYEAFKRGHQDNNFSVDEFNTIIKHAQNQGLLWQLSFGDFLLLKPEILNDYASAIIRVARNHPKGLGSVLENDILNSNIDFEDMERINKDSEKLLLHAVVKLLIDREVALREGEYIIFPSKFNRNYPPLTKFPPMEIIFDFKGPIEDIYASLIVRISYSGVFGLKSIWKDSVEFKDSSNNIYGFKLNNSGGRGKLLVFFDEKSSGDIKKLFSNFIYDHLSKKAIKGSLKKEKIFRCPYCGEEVKNRRAIKFRLESGRKDIICQYCDMKIPLVENGEIETNTIPAIMREIDDNIMEKKEEASGITTAKAKTEIGEFDVFLAHNSDDKDDVEKIANELKSKGLNPWLDKWNVPPGRLFQDEIQKAFPNIKSVAVFVGRKGIGPWQDLEIKASISLFIKEKLPVIPVLLPSSPDKPEMPLFLKEFNWVKFNEIDDKDALSNLEWGITGKNPFKDHI
jgi:small GTP-binding protein